MRYSCIWKKWLGFLSYRKWHLDKANTHHFILNPVQFWTRVMVFAFPGHRNLLKFISLLVFSAKIYSFGDFLNHQLRSLKGLKEEQCNKWQIAEYVMCDVYRQEIAHGNVWNNMQVKICSTWCTVHNVHRAEVL